VNAPLVMLAESHRRIAPSIPEAIDVLASRGYLFSVKYDGVRMVAHVEHGRVTLTGRRGLDATARFPEITASLARKFPAGVWTLDGEVVVFTGGKPDFAATHRRDAQASTAAITVAARRWPAAYCAFDVLVADGADLRRTPQRVRSATLRALQLRGIRLRPVREFHDGPAAWRFVTRRGLEGLVAKAPSAVWAPGRSGAWVKLKPEHRVSAVVVGATAGNGSRAATFGALQLALVGPAGVVEFGRVGSGLSTQELIRVRAGIDRGRLQVAEISVSALLEPSGMPRHPVFLSLRDDIAPVDCTIDQLVDVPRIEAAA
jgi:bifunctional non-homologous end joining protein LigD